MAADAGPWTLDTQAAYKKYATRREGLTDEEVEEKKKLFGPNGKGL